jgi:SAM-dependent methyltransferase
MSDRLSSRAREACECPACAGQLRWSATSARCVACAAEYQIARGVPLLMPQFGSLFDADEVAAASGTRTSRSGLRRLIPEISHNGAAKRNYESIKAMVANPESPSLVLFVGGGEAGKGSAALSGDGVEVVVSDVAIADSTHVCLDAHKIPFRAGTFDVVVAQAVLEHVLDPIQCVAEMHRVLKPDGIIYAETPFMQQVHMGAYDFTRFSLLGHRRLFRRFTEIDSGIAVGPGSALAWSFVYFMTSFSRGTRSRRLLNSLSRMAVFWLKYFDKLLATRPAATDAAAGVFFLGRKSSKELGDRELIAQYRGAL